MRSTFGGLNIASSGLFISQRQIDVTSHNVANANTVGYSRQRYVTSAVDAKGVNSQFASPVRGTVGGGVETLSLDQIRDKFLDQQYRTENSNASYWSTRSNALYYVEDVFNSTDATSLNGVLNSFYNSLQELSKNTTDEAIRTNVASEANKLTETFNMYHDQLTSLLAQQDSNLVAQVKGTNDLLTQLSSLNEMIFRFELGGSTANDLRDERNLVLDELSSLMDITYTEQSYDPPMYNLYGVELTKLNVYAGSGSGDDYTDNLLCSHDEAFYLVCEAETGLNDIADEKDPPIDTHNVYLASGVELFFGDVEGLNTGMLKSYVDIRDGNSMDNQGIPYFLEQLNVMVRSLVYEFNSLHSMGYTMPYSGTTSSSDSQTGVDFFNPEGLTADTISLSEEILQSVFNIAVSSEYVTLDDDGHFQTGNNINILDIIKGIKERTDLDEVGSYEGYFKNFLGNLASEVSKANNFSDSRLANLDSIGSQRLSVMGVSVDEEMTNLIKFQHAYNSASRAITTMDEALDKLINGTGRVGL